MKKSKCMIGWYLFLLACILVGCICGCVTVIKETNVFVVDPVIQVEVEVK